MGETVTHAAEPAATSGPAIRDLGAERRRLSVLIVDSDVRTARVLAGLLASDGVDAEVTADGKPAALRIAEGPLPDALIVNVTTPPIDGVRATRVARARDASLPVLLITAYPHLGAEWGPTQGPPPVVYAKPLDYGRLVALLDELRPLA